MENLIGKQVKIIEVHHPHVGEQGVALRIQTFKQCKEPKALVIKGEKGNFCVFSEKSVELVERKKKWQRK